MFTTNIKTLLLVALSPSMFVLDSEGSNNLLGAAMPLGLSSVGLVVLALRIFAPGLVRMAMVLLRVFACGFIFLLAGYTCDLMGLDSYEVLTTIAHTTLPHAWVNTLGEHSGFLVLSLAAIIIYQLLSFRMFRFWVVGKIRKYHYSL